MGVLLDTSPDVIKYEIHPRGTMYQLSWQSIQYLNLAQSDELTNTAVSTFMLLAY